MGRGKKAIVLICIFHFVTFCNSAYAQPDVRITTGHGLNSPYKTIRNPLNTDQIFIVTGGGEFFGASSLSLFDATSLQLIGSPLEVCQNASDILESNGYIYIACRGSNEVVKIEISTLSIVDRVETGERPISIDSISDNRLVVSHFGDGNVVTIETINSELVVSNTLSLDSIPYTVASDLGWIYVILSSGKILELDDDLNVARTFNVGSQPSFDAIVMSQRIFVTDRDGYVIVIDRNTGDFNFIDLAEKLGLERSDIELRGIDPFGLIRVDDDKLLVVNNRQSSVVLDIKSFNSEGLHNYPVIHTLPAGIGAVHIGNLDKIFLTRLGNTIINCSLDKDSDMADCSSVSTGTTNKLMAVSEETVAMLFSDGALRIFSKTNFISGGQENNVIPGVWENIKPDIYNGGFQGIRENSQGYELVSINVQGEELGVLEIADIPFSLSVGIDQTLLVNRLQGSITRVLNIRETGAAISEVIHVLSRPREAIQNSNGDWLVIHDTHPDIGLTRLTHESVVHENYSIGNDFLTAIEFDEQSGETYLATSRGHIARLDSNLETVKLNSIVTNEASELVVVDNELWMISGSDSKAVKLNKLSLQPEDEASISNLVTIFPLGNDSGWVATHSELQYWSSLDFDPYSNNLIRISSPENDSVVLANGVTVDWKYTGPDIPSAAWLYVGTQAGRRDIWNSGRLSAEPSYLNLPLLPEGIAYITVFSLVDGDWIQSSSTITVKNDTDETELPIPSEVQLVSPIGSSNRNAPVYTWNPVVDADAYNLWVRDETGVIENVWYEKHEVGCESSLSACSITTEAQVVGNAVWWVRAGNRSGNGPWGSPNYFNEVSSGLPGAAELIAPVGARDDGEFAFSWNAVPGATWYFLHVEDLARSRLIGHWFTEAQANCVGGAGVCEITADVQVSVHARWWIRTWNSSGHGLWSAPFEIWPP